MFHPKVILDYFICSKKETSESKQTEDGSEYDSESQYNNESEYSDYSEMKEENDYEFTANINKSLSEILYLPEFKSDELVAWEPPKEHGLKNSEYIIPIYYKRPENRLLHIDYFKLIKDDIRNFRILNKYQMDYIKNLEHDQKNELLAIFNDCMQAFSNV